MPGEVSGPQRANLAAQPNAAADAAGEDDSVGRTPARAAVSGIAREIRGRVMFGSIGMPELIIIFVIALIIFGPRKLPELGKSLGKSIAEFKRASNELRNTLEEEIRVDEQRQKTAAPLPAASSTAPLSAVPTDPAVRVTRARPPKPWRMQRRLRPRTRPLAKPSRADGTRSLPRPRSIGRRCRPLGRARRRGRRREDDVPGAPRRAPEAHHLAASCHRRRLRRSPSASSTRSTTS